MQEWISTQPDIAFPDSEYARLLGLPMHRGLEGRSRELAAAAREWYAREGRPWTYGLRVEDLHATEDNVRIAGRSFSSPGLRSALQTARAHACVLVAVSAGPECEARAQALWTEEKPDEYFFTEILGSAVVEHLVTQAGAQLCAWADSQRMAVLPHISPGYTGWDVGEQPALSTLFPGALPGPLRVLDSGMLSPRKSLLAVFGLTRHRELVAGNLVPCERCAFANCQYRRAPYIYTPAEAAAPSAPLISSPAYRTSVRALRKWAQERLQLQFGADGSVRAQFRYDGTTCSNMGHPLAFNYYVELGPAETRYKLLRATCFPVAADTGHQKMCAYLERGPALLESIREPAPLCGQPLDAVLSWERTQSPAGCYCTAAARDHKWGLVLETIHYALVQRQNSANQNT